VTVAASPMASARPNPVILQRAGIEGERGAAIQAS
jgi:hypothetical protein